MYVFGRDTAGNCYVRPRCFGSEGNGQHRRAQRQRREMVATRDCLLFLPAHDTHEMRYRGAGVRLSKQTGRVSEPSGDTLCAIHMRSRKQSTYLLPICRVHYYVLVPTYLNCLLRTTIVYLRGTPYFNVSQSLHLTQLTVLSNGGSRSRPPWSAVAEGGDWL